MQKFAMQRAAAARGDKIGAWYSEKKSARTIARPGLSKLRQDARAGHIRRIYCYRLDRLARSGIRDMLEVVEGLRGHGCEVVSVADGFDLNGPVSEIVLCVMAWAAKMERLAINERISAARLRVGSEGRSWGRPRSLDDAQVAKVIALRRRGRSLRQIASACRLPISTIGDSPRCCADS